MPLLIDHFITRFNVMQNKEVTGISDEMLSSLMSCHYPGNVRELENIIERSFVLCRSGQIEPRHLSDFPPGAPAEKTGWRTCEAYTCRKGLVRIAGWWGSPASVTGNRQEDARHAMKLAMPVSADRISTVFDFARHLLVVGYEDGCEVDRIALALEEYLPLSRVRRLETLGTSVLICGAISRSLAERLANAGIDIVPFVSGPVEEVRAAYRAGELGSARFLMPGSTFQDRAEWRSRRQVR